MVCDTNELKIPDPSEIGVNPFFTLHNALINRRRLRETKEAVVLPLPGKPIRQRVCIHRDKQDISGFDYYCPCGRFAQFVFE